MNSVVISEQLAGALINLINVGTFPFKYQDIKQVEAELFKAIEASNIPVVYTDDPKDAQRAVMSLVKEGE